MDGPMGMPSSPPPPPEMGAPGMAPPPGAHPGGLSLTIHLPATVDPSLVDQLTSAVHRMGGQVQPDVNDMEGMQEDMGEPGPEGPMEPPPDTGMPPGPPPGMEFPPPMSYGDSGIKRPSQLRTPVPKR